MGIKETKTKELAEGLKNLEVDIIGTARLEGPEAGTELEKANILLPAAKSVVVMAMEIPVEIFRHLTYRQEVGNIELRDMYHQTEQLLSGRLNWEAYRLVKQLHTMGYQALALPAGGPYDARFLEGAFSYKHAALEAGIGFIGWHSLLITPEYGPRVKLAVVLTDAIMESSRRSENKNHVHPLRCVYTRLPC